MPDQNRNAAGTLYGFALWIADQAKLSLPELHAAFCDKLAARGLPLWRSSLGLELLHPEQSGTRSIWTLNEGVTVLGPAVNYASRLQDLAKGLGRTILMSRTFAGLLTEPVVDLGDHPLRGIGEAERIFALPTAP